MEDDVQMCLREKDGEVNSFDRPRKTHTFVNVVLAPSGTVQAWQFLTG